MASAQKVKLLRQLTGAGIMDCKQALLKFGDNQKEAIDWLREKNMVVALKKSTRQASEGVIGTYLGSDGKIGVIVEINSETDFVAKNQVFRAFVKDVAIQIAKTDPLALDGSKDSNSLLSQSYIKEPGKTLKDVLTETVGKLGENLVIRRFIRYKLDDGMIGTYIHGDGKIGVMVEINSKTDTVVQNEIFKSFVKDVAMQIAAMNPLVVNEADLSDEDIEAERKVLKNKAISDGKKPEVLDKVVEGQINKWKASKSLLSQPYVKDSSKTLKDVLVEAAKELGEKLIIKRFVRYELGEGS